MVRKDGELGFFTMTVLFAALALVTTGCTGGTTYGTGVSQEKQTVSDLYNILSLKRKTPDIDYSARPDLIVPENTAALPEPVDAEATTSNPEWPETPEQRIARIRAQAGEVDPRSGDYSIEEQLRPKEGIAIETRNTGKFVPGQTDRSGSFALNPSLEAGAREEVIKRREELKASKTQRRYLTEPPNEYRTPYASAPAGEEAYTEEDRLLRKDEEMEERERRNKERGRSS